MGERGYYLGRTVLAHLVADRSVHEVVHSDAKHLLNTVGDVRKDHGVIRGARVVVDEWVVVIDTFDVLVVRTDVALVLLPV